MKKKLVRGVTGILFIATLFTSCDVSNYSNESNCPVLLSVPATAVTGPTSAAINQEITLNVSYKSRVNCSDFSAFHKQSLANQRTITTTVTYDACACTDSIVSIRTEAFKFKEAAAGVYEFKFKKEADGFVNHTVTVGDATAN